ncbi:transposase [Thermoflexus hugenholtzii]
MPYDPQCHHRRSIRLPGYDYTQPGAYFVTIVTHNRMPLFGEIVDGEMRLNEYGEIVRAEWFRTAIVRPYVVLHPDEFVVMPNHVHGIVWIVGDDNAMVGAQRRCAPTGATITTWRAVGGATPTNVIPGSLGAIVRSFKSITARRINDLRDTPGAPVWQRNYYEHIIRNEEALARIRAYIQANPERWADDLENPFRNPKPW